MTGADRCGKTEAGGRDSTRVSDLERELKWGHHLLREKMEEAQTDGKILV